MIVRLRGCVWVGYLSSLSRINRSNIQLMTRRYVYNVLYSTRTYKILPIPDQVLKILRKNFIPIAGQYLLYCGLEIN